MKKKLLGRFAIGYLAWVLAVEKAKAWDETGGEQVASLMEAAGKIGSIWHLAWPVASGALSLLCFAMAASSSLKRTTPWTLAAAAGILVCLPFWFSISSLEQWDFPSQDKPMESGRR